MYGLYHFQPHHSRSPGMGHSLDPLCRWTCRIETTAYFILSLHIPKRQTKNNMELLILLSIKNCKFSTQWHPALSSSHLKMNLIDAEKQCFTALSGSNCKICCVLTVVWLEEEQLFIILAQYLVTVWLSCFTYVTKDYLAHIRSWVGGTSL